MRDDDLGRMGIGDWVSAYCQACDRYVSLDVPSLIAKLGPDFRVTRLCEVVRCSVCGGPGKIYRGHDHNKAMLAKSKASPSSGC